MEEDIIKNGLPEYQFKLSLGKIKTDKIQKKKQKKQRERFTAGPKT